MNAKERRALKRAHLQALQSAQQPTALGNAKVPNNTTLANPGNGGNIIGFPPLTGTQGGNRDSGGYGMPLPVNTPASGGSPVVNPFIIPKSTGLNVISQSFPSQYYTNWSLSSWRQACDQATLQGWPISYAALTTWVYECSPFVQSLFGAWGRALDEIPFFITDLKGNPIDELTNEFCNKYWLKQLRREILFSLFWGFSGLNFDPVAEKVYKYPQQQLDCINKMLRSSTFDLGNGIMFSDMANLLYVQPSENYESFLGMMQPIAREFIMMNMNDVNWEQAGRRLAFPILVFGYPQDSTQLDPDTGQTFNDMKIQTEAIAAAIDPSQSLVVPYVRNAQTGEIEYTLQVNQEGGKASASAHRIYSDFNEMRKNDIREMVLGGILTATTGKNGNRSLGEIQERKFETVITAAAEFVVSYLNSEFKRKICAFYKGVNPERIRFEYDRSRKWTLEEIEQLSNILTANGYKLTDTFFEKFGLSKEFFEPVPTAVTKPIPNDGLSAVYQFAGSTGKKKALW